MNALFYVALAIGVSAGLMLFEVIDFMAREKASREVGDGR